MSETYAPIIPTYGTQNRPKYNGPVRPGLGTGVSNTKPLAVTMQQAEGQPKQPTMADIMEQAISYYAINPNAGPDPRFTTGNRALDLEAQRLGRIRNFQMSGTGKTAVEAAKAQQWMSGQRSLADEMPGTAVPAYAAKPEVGPPRNGVWQAPDGNRYLMVDGVVSGVAGGAPVEKGEWIDRNTRLGQMREMFDKAMQMEPGADLANFDPNQVNRGQVRSLVAQRDAAFNKLNQWRDQGVRQSEKDDYMKSLNAYETAQKKLEEAVNTLNADRNVSKYGFGNAPQPTMSTAAPTTPTAMPVQAAPAATATTPTPAPAVSPERLELGRYKVREALAGSSNPNEALRKAVEFGLISPQLEQQIEAEKVELTKAASQRVGRYRTDSDALKNQIDEVQKEYDGLRNNRAASAKRFELKKKLEGLKNSRDVLEKLIDDAKKNLEPSINESVRRYLNQILVQ